MREIKQLKHIKTQLPEYQYPRLLLVYFSLGKIEIAGANVLKITAFVSFVHLFLYILFIYMCTQRV